MQSVFIRITGYTLLTLVYVGLNLLFISVEVRLSLEIQDNLSLILTLTDNNQRAIAQLNKFPNIQRTLTFQ